MSSFSSNDTWCVKQSASILAEDFGKQVFCVSFRGYLRPCDFANPAFCPAVYFNWGLPLRANEQTRLRVRTYWCSRRENDWRLKKKSWKKSGVSDFRDGRMARTINQLVHHLFFFSPFLESDGRSNVAGRRFIAWLSTLES